MTEATSILEELLNVTVPALEGNNSAAYDLKEMNDNDQRVMLGPQINYNEEEKTINAMVGAVRQLMSDPESQLMAAVAIGIGTLNNRFCCWCRLLQDNRPTVDLIYWLDSSRNRPKGVLMTMGSQCGGVHQFSQGITVWVIKQME